MTGWLCYLFGHKDTDSGATSACLRRRCLAWRSNRPYGPWMLGYDVLSPVQRPWPPTVVS